MLKVYDLLYRKAENNEGKTQWEKVGVLLEKENGKMSVKIDFLPIGQWDGWLVVAERRASEKKQDSDSDAQPF